MLDVAWEAACGLPDDPHRKTKARLQEETATAAVALGADDLARRALDAMSGWRAGMVAAGLAERLTATGRIEDVRDLLARAARCADDEASREDFQAWRRDRVRARIAGVYLRLGDPVEAARFEADAADSEAATADVVRAEIAFGPSGFDERLAAADAALAGDSFDRARVALESCVRLFDVFYDDPARRAAAEKRVTSGYAKLPPAARLAHMAELVRVAAKHVDRAAARRLADVFAESLDATPWLPVDRIARRAQLAQLRAVAGDAEGAKSALDAALADFDAQRPAIVDVERADALRPAAEACVALGDPARASDLYRRATDEGAANPNARPRAVDLVATCTSMAKAGFVPDAALLERIKAVRAGLKAPW
ncbi:MAG TPA: hypothetical protein VEI02_11385 [Planctomycetota bacterium]|nr:hypothetical protein [Planctomycetota bacterium]